MSLIKSRPARVEKIPVATSIRIHESAGDRVFLAVNYVLLSLVLAAVLVPLLYIVASSFSSPQAVSSGQVFLWPIDPTIEGYRVALSNPAIVTGYVNSLIYAVGGTLISTALTIAIAYPLARKNLAGQNVIMIFILITMLFSGGLIPTYLVVQNLGMLNTRWALLIPNAIAVWQVIIARTYFRSAIPDELAEAAELDGASDLRFLWSVVLPLSKPLIAVIALMYAISQWNAYFDALIYLKDPGLYPLQLVLRNILILNSSAGGGITDVAQQMQREQMADLLKYALIVIASVPVLAVYPFVARHFTKGVMIGAVKG